MTDEIIDETVSKITEEAQAEFDLFNNVSEQVRVEDTIRLFRDEVSGKKLGTAYDGRNEAGIMVRQRSGILGRIDELESRIETELTDEEREELTELIEEAAGLREKLFSTSFTVTLRAFPEIAEKVAKRETRKRFIKKGMKQVADEDAEDMERFWIHSLLVNAIVEVKQASGAIKNSLTMDEVETLQAQILPKTEWARLREKLDEVQFEQKISRDAGRELDF